MDHTLNYPSGVDAGNSGALVSVLFEPATGLRPPAHWSREGPPERTGGGSEPGHHSQQEDAGRTTAREPRLVNPQGEWMSQAKDRTSRSTHVLAK